KSSLEQCGGIIPGNKLPVVPLLFPQIAEGRVLLGAKAEKPVSRGRSGDMGLVHPADRERSGNIPVRPLAGQSVLLVKRTLMLVYHDPVLFQSLVAVPVKFPGKQAFSRAERICRIYNDQIVFILTSADKLQSVLIVDLHSLVLQAAGGLRQIFLTYLYYHLVDLHQIDLLY